ncbi:integrase [Povalibacter uvarum]|uniref:Integrase n=1 Tax=Povalibacter uvarum TaxID=732238 RepID=A0A841HUI2_9GAMM|nr:tyrosine-type recombinase/integrase [Povalibacter uvarum]MBB6095642.1 integrase [Povalibacter uvarum]
MGNRKTSGLTKRGGIWHIDKIVRGTRIRESTGTSEIGEAEALLARRIEEARNASLFGVRPDRTFRVAATKFLKENQHKRTIDNDAMHLKRLDPFIGHLWLRQVHMGTLQSFIDKRRSEGVKTLTINLAMTTVRRILNLAANEWRDELGMTWLQQAPKIKMLPVTDKRSPYPLSREEQAMLFQQLPDYLARMALFKVNTGCREQEVCGLKWSDEVPVPELGTSVFIISGERVKNDEDRLVVLNRVAHSIIESVRGMHSEFVFARLPTARKGASEDELASRTPVPIVKMNTTAWKAARERAASEWESRHGEPAPDGFRRARVHDLKHTFGRRLRSAGVSFEDRQDLLGHKSGRITTHYSAAEVSNLVSAAEKACSDESHKGPTITCLRRRSS